MMYKTRNGSCCMVALVGLLQLLSCVETTDFKSPNSVCENNEIATVPFATLRDVYKGEVAPIQEDITLKGYVVSTDLFGNFFGELYIQDAITNPTTGILLEVDLRDTHLWYPVGSEVYIQLQGLYLSIKNDVYVLGGALNVFGSTTIGRLPANKIRDHLISGCENFAITPAQVGIANLAEIPLHTLVRIEDVEFVMEELGEAFAVRQEETMRTIVDCDKNQLQIRNSGFSDFQSETIPEKNGSITGILIKKGKERQLVIRTLDDINFSLERCVAIPDEFTSEALFISEIADPDNNSGARFVELYNAANTTLSLNGWELRRFTNGNTTVSSTIDLSGLEIKSNATLVVSPNSVVFESVYGFPPDLEVGTNSPADSNGDDNLILVDPFGTIIDSFGIVGEDGSGTNHEFEDGRANRNIAVLRANPNYNFEEWTIFNDTGAAGTRLSPQNAPEDYTPRIR